MADPDKISLRQKMKATRLNMEPSEREVANHQITQNICAYLSQISFQNIAIYMPIQGEVCTRALYSFLQEQQKTILLPLVHEGTKQLSFHVYEDNEKLNKGAYGVLEPSIDAQEALPDCVIVPGLAFDKRGGRLGYGGGYYDVTLASIIREKELKIIALCYDFQCLDCLDLQAHDVL